MSPIDLYPTRRPIDGGADPTPRAEHLTWEQSIARYPRLTRSLAYAGYSTTEAGCAIRDYRTGSIYSGEAINYTGGTRRALERASRDWHRHIAQRATNPDGYTARTIARYQAEHGRKEQSTR